MTPDPHHHPNVSAAIQAALNNIDLLRALVDAADDATGKKILAVLKKHDPKFDLKKEELLEFWTSLTTGKMEMDAKTLVDYYNDLESRKKTVKGRPPQNEWNP